MRLMKLELLCFTLFCNSTNVVMNYSEIESKVREATNDDPWGPSGQLMGEIAKYVCQRHAGHVHIGLNHHFAVVGSLNSTSFW